MEIKIKGNFVELYEKTPIGVTTLEEFKKHLIDDYGIETPFFTDKCRYYKRIKNKEVVILQFDKQNININFRKEKYNDKCPLQKFHISVPSTVFIWIGQSCYLFFTNTRVDSLDTKLYRALFTNVHLDGNICFGDIKDSGKILTLKEKEILCKEFFTSEFNNDLPTHAYDYMQWDKDTKANDNFYIKIMEEKTTFMNTIKNFLQSKGC